MLRVVCKIAFATPLVLCAVAIAFQATLYWKIPVENNEPAGGGEIIEWLLFMALFFASIASLALGLLVLCVPRVRNVGVALKLLLSGALSPVVYWFLEPLTPRLM